MGAALVRLVGEETAEVMIPGRGGGADLIRVIRPRYHGFHAPSVIVVFWWILAAVRFIKIVLYDGGAFLTF